MIIVEGTKFDYSFQDEAGHVIGKLILPTYLPTAENSEVRKFIPAQLRDYVRIALGADEYRVEYERLDRKGMASGLRFNLVRNEKTLASALVRRNKIAFKWPPFEIAPIEIDAGRPLQLLGSGFTSFSFEVKDGGRQVGRIGEEPGFRFFSRRFFIDLPDDLSPELKFFVFFLAANRAFR